MSFNKIDFLRDLIDDVASSERAGKKFEADAAILGPLLVGVQRELSGERIRVYLQSLEIEISSGADPLDILIDSHSRQKKMLEKLDHSERKQREHQRRQMKT